MSFGGEVVAIGGTAHVNDLGQAESRRPSIAATIKPTAPSPGPHAMRHANRAEPAHPTRSATLPAGMHEVCRSQDHLEQVGTKNSRDTEWPSSKVIAI